MVNTPRRDITGRVWNPNALVYGYQDRESLAKILNIAPEAPMVFDVVYQNHNEEYPDAKCLGEIVADRAPSTHSEASLLDHRLKAEVIRDQTP